VPATQIIGLEGGSTAHLRSWEHRACWCSGKALDWHLMGFLSRFRRKRR